MLHSLRVVPGIASDQVCLGAGGRERSALVPEERGMCMSCTGVCVQGVLVWSRAGLSRCDGHPRVNQTQKGSGGDTDLCHGADVLGGPQPSLPFYPEHKDDTFRVAIAIPRLWKCSFSPGKMHSVCGVCACLQMLVPPSTSPWFPSNWLLPLADLVIVFLSLAPMLLMFSASYLCTAPAVPAPCLSLPR